MLPPIPLVHQCLQGVGRCVLLEADIGFRRSAVPVKRVQYTAFPPIQSNIHIPKPPKACRGRMKHVINPEPKNANEGPQVPQITLGHAVK